MAASTSPLQQAMQFHQAGESARAAQLYETHLGQHPGDANATHLLGVLYHQLGEYQRAVEVIGRAIELDASQWEYLSNRGAAQRALGHIDDAIESFRRACELCPDKPEPLNNLGAAYLDKGCRDDARRYLEEAIAVAPGHVESHLNLGSLCRKEGKLDEAIECFARTLQYAPDTVAAYMQRAEIQLKRRRPWEAVADYQQAIDRKSDTVGAYVGKGRVQMLQRQFDEALQTMAEALELDRESAVAHFSCAEILLGQGQWSRGWEEYEWRFRMIGGPARRDFGVPEWRGESLAGKRLLVYGEQSLADEVMFARAIAAVLPRADDCLVECDASLVGLFRRSFGNATVHQRDLRDTSWVDAAGTPDFQIAAGSLLGRLMVTEPGVTEPAIAEPTPYLTPDADAVAKWRGRLATLGAGLKVGLGWHSRKGEPSIGEGLDQWAKLVQTPGVHWVNLQAGEVEDVLAESMSRWGVEIHDWEDADSLNDIDGLAAQMMALDLVICTDGMVAQLAAACGAEVWVLAGHDPNWRWGYEHQQGQRCHGVRLFRPSVPTEQGGSWSELPQEVAIELVRHVSQENANGAQKDTVVVVDEAVREEAARLKKQHPTFDDQRSGLDGATVTEAIRRAKELHKAKEDLELAEHICRLVLQRVPHRAEALHRLGALLTSLDRPDEGLEFAQQATELCPYSPAYYYQLAATFMGLERFDDAAESLRQTVRLQPDLAEAWINFGAALERSVRTEEAEIICRRGVEMSPQSASALYNLANVLLPLGKVDESQAAYDHVVELDPEFPKGHWNRGLCYLVQGKFEEGWKEYEWREAAEEVRLDKFDVPSWDGKSSLRDKFILLHAEQGIGDELMFGTCLPDVIRQAGRVMITCEPRLKDLFDRSFPDVAVVAMRRAMGDQLTTPAGLDFHLPVGSLPLYLRPRWEDFPGTPYLQADPEKVAMWRERLDRLGPDLKIGISWRAGGVAREQRRRTSPLDHWEPLFRLPGVQFVNLQYGKCKDDLKRAREEFGTEIHHWDDANPLKDLDAAAAQISALDMVVSVGNTTIHTAGALGIETWVALPHVPGWRYLISGEKMPWYGCARLVRQAEDRDWSKLLKRMASELDEHLGLSSGTRTSRPLSVAWEPAQQDAPNPVSETPVSEAPVSETPVSETPVSEAPVSEAPVSEAPVSETPVSETLPKSDSPRPAVPAESDVPVAETSERLQRAVTHHQGGDLAAAERIYRDILSAQPNYLDALYLMGTLASQTDRLTEAVGLLQQALRCDPLRPEIHYNLANALRKAQNRQQAAEHFRRAIELSPEFLLAHLNLSATLHELGCSDDALEILDRAVQIDSQLAEVHHNRGSVLVDVGRFDEAVVAFGTALQIKPDYAEAHAHLAGTLRALGQLDQAKACYEAALRLRPHEADTRVNRAMLLLQQGQFNAGWQEYEWRWGAADGPRPRATSLPTWNGEPLTGKTLLVWGEQGVGDEIMFASCVGEVAGMAQDCILECSPGLVSLFARSFPGVSVVAPSTTAGSEPGVRCDRADDHADVQIASGSLPRFLRRSLGSFPQRESFLVADPLRCQQWQARLAELGPGLKVGISWRSGSNGPDRGQRTIDLTLWRDLIATEGTQFVSLQYGDVESEIAGFQRSSGLSVHRWADEDSSGDFDELAAKVASLDLVISVANATVHLAGGLGVDTWTLTPMAPSWRWLEDKSTSPWYPRMSVYSQASRGDWRGVLGDVQQRLEQRLAEDCPTGSQAVGSQATASQHRPIAAPHLGLGHLQGLTGQPNQPAG